MVPGMSTWTITFGKEDNEFDDSDVEADGDGEEIDHSSRRALSVDF